MVKGPEPSDGVDAFRIAIYFVPACCILLTAAWFSLLARGVISGLVFVVLLLLNLLIDLYRKLGRRDRLTVELARCADRYRGTPPGAAAAQELRELKARGGG